MTPSIKLFKQTSDKPYDRHHYLLVTKDNKSIMFDDYDQLRAVWFQRCHTGMLSHVIVQDNVQYNTHVRASDTKGFK